MGALAVEQSYHLKHDLTLCSIQPLSLGREVGEWVGGSGNIW